MYGEMLFVVTPLNVTESFPPGREVGRHLVVDEVIRADVTSRAARAVSAARGRRLGG